MEIDHFSHEHPLTLIESEKKISRKNRKKKITCKGCQKFCTVPLYACTQCSFYLHKSCAKLPTEFQNPFHQHGPLILLFDGNKSFPCWACFKSCNGFYFHCEVCKFDLHVDCAFLMTATVTEEEEEEEEEEEKEEEEQEEEQEQEQEQEQESCKQLQHFTHLHPLVLVEKKDELLNRIKCLVCGEHCFGACYGCDPCGIFLHKPCAEFQYPRKIHNFTHSCPLTLQTRVHPFRCEACDTCMLGISYHCEQCKFNIDVECALLESIKSEDGRQIKHFNHRHPLALSEKLGDSDQVHCLACGKHCLGPTYVCNKNKREFSLHEFCAAFAPKIYDYLHPYHPLSLLLRPTNTTQVGFRCNACCGDCRGLTYRCELCDFNLHMKCTGQVPNIKYLSHEHLLLFVEKMGAEVMCNSCNNLCDSSVLHCPQCDFNLHVHCGPLPFTMKHKCHVDSLTLVDSPVEYDSEDEFYCDVCEEERDPRLPIYYCAGCGLVAEVSCVMSEVTLWLKGDYGDVELRTAIGKIAGKVISERQEAMEMCKNEAAQATKILSDPGVEEMEALHDLLTLDQILKSDNVMHQKGVAQGIRIQSKPEVGGKFSLTWKHILDSFSEDERKELNDVLMSEEPETSSDEQNTVDELDSLDDSLFLDKALKDLMQTLYSGPLELMDLWNKEEEVVYVRDYLVPQSLAPILECLFSKYGDVSVDSTLSSRVKMYLFVILCGIIDSVCDTRILDITETKLTSWWKYLTSLKSAGFKIQFVLDQLKSYQKAYFGLRLREQERVTLDELDVDITRYSAAVEEMTTKLDCLKFDRERIISEKTRKKSSLIEDCFKAAIKLKWKKAGEGLIKLG